MPGLGCGPSDHVPEKATGKQRNRSFRGARNRASGGAQPQPAFHDRRSPSRHRDSQVHDPAAAAHARGEGAGRADIELQFLPAARSGHLPLLRRALRAPDHRHRRTGNDRSHPAGRLAPGAGPVRYERDGRAREHDSHGVALRRPFLALCAAERYRLRFAPTAPPGSKGSFSNSPAATWMATSRRTPARGASCIY